ALQDPDGAKVVIAGETIRCQGNDLGKHGRSILIARMSHVKEAQPIVGRPIAGTERDRLFVQLFGIRKTAESFIGSCKTPLGIGARGFNLDHTPILLSGPLVVALRIEDPTETRMRFGDARLTFSRILTVLDGCSRPVFGMR